MKFADQPSRSRDSDLPRMEILCLMERISVARGKAALCETHH
jgi:hypothetical protein